MSILWNYAPVPIPQGSVLYEVWSSVLAAQEVSSISSAMALQSNPYHHLNTNIPLEKEPVKTLEEKQQPKETHTSAWSWLICMTPREMPFLFVGNIFFPLLAQQQSALELSSSNSSVTQRKMHERNIQGILIQYYSLQGKQEIDCLKGGEDTLGLSIWFFSVCFFQYKGNRQDRERSGFLPHSAVNDLLHIKSSWKTQRSSGL